MRILLAFGLLLAVLTLDARREAAAQWCAYYDEYTYTCGFVSFNQCLATVSGAGGACRRDYAYRPPLRDDRRAAPPRGTWPSGNRY